MLRKIIDTLGLYWLVEMWNRHYDFSVAEMIFYFSIFLVGDAVIFIGRWWIYNSAIRDVGFPKRNDKYIRKKYKSYSFFEKITLWGIYSDAEHRSIYLLLCLLRNAVNLIAAAASVVGFVGCILTHCDGWIFCLFAFSEIGSCIIDFVVRLIPDLIWNKTLRDKYIFRK